MPYSNLIPYYSYPNTSLISSNPELLGYASLMHKFLVHHSAARIGSQVWTTENMRHVSGTNSISVNAGNGVYSHNDDISNDKTHGKYYPVY
jgi:hypothetical protein